MSQATRIAVVAAMSGDADLVALLAKDPADGTSPAIFDGTRNQAPPVYNCITFRVETAAPDNRFRPPPAAGGGASSVEDEYFDIEAWSQKPDSADIEAIAACLDALFDGRSLTLTGGGSVFWSERVLSQPDHYDDQLNAWFGLFRYRLRVRK